MRRIERSSRFKRDFQREKAGQFGIILDQLISDLLYLLANDQPLPVKYRDHALIGNWRGHRDCHMKPDLILIYRKPDDDTLELVRLGSHGELNL